MTTAREALARMRASERVPLGGELGLPIDPSEVLRPCLTATERLEAASRTTGKPSATTLEQAKQAWAASGHRIEDLSDKQVRVLCWDPDTATDAAFVRGVAHHPERPQKRRWIEGLIESYIAKWRRMREPAALEQMLIESVQGFSGRSDRISNCLPVAKTLFSAAAPNHIGMQVVSACRSIESVLCHWRIDLSSGLGEATANAAVEAWVAQFEREKGGLRGAAAYDSLEQLTKQLLACPAVGQSAASKAMSAIALWDVAAQDGRFHRELKAFVLESPRFGDPRLPSRQNNWSLVEPEAKQRIIGWMAKGDLLFFFKFVITDDPHGRRDFWLRYIERAIDAHVALSEEDALRLRAQVKERLSHSIVVGGQGTSAFLMRFQELEDVLCVEFSRTGNALYVHNSEEFLRHHRSIRQPRFLLSGQLKDARAMRDRFVHSSSWQETVRHYLTQLGIRPA